MEVSDATEDKNLISLIVKNDECAFGLIYNKYSPLLYRYAYSRIRDKATCEEMIQEVFVWLWEKRATLSHVIALKPYLYAAIRHKIVDHIAHSVVRERYIQHYLLYESKHDNSLEDQTNVSDFFPQLEKYISVLPKNCQVAFRLSRLDHVPIPKIAEQMNLSTGTVENYISQALKHLRNVLIP
ncbi:MAG: RNA polymerase sigma-70 factor [Cyclobacteriaceae bacterium]